MNVESRVVVPRHQPFDFFAVKDFLIFQRAQKPGTEVNGNSDRGASLQFMKTSFPNKPGKHQRMKMGMEIEQAAVGLQTEDPALRPSQICRSSRRYSCQACHALRSSSLPSLRLRRS